MCELGTRHSGPTAARPTGLHPRITRSGSGGVTAAGRSWARNPRSPRRSRVAGIPGLQADQESTDPQLRPVAKRRDSQPFAVDDDSASGQIDHPQPARRKNQPAVITGDIVRGESNLALGRATDESDEPVDVPAVARALPIPKFESDGVFGSRDRGVRLKWAISRRKCRRARRHTRTEAQLKRTNPNRHSDIQPARTGALSRPSQSGATSQVDREYAPAKDLQPCVSRVHLGIGQCDVAGIVAADEREGHWDRPLGPPSDIDQIDAQVERCRRAAGLREPGDDGIFHGQRGLRGPAVSRGEIFVEPTAGRV